jgi:hypothetical protein
MLLRLFEKKMIKSDRTRLHQSHRPLFAPNTMSSYTFKQQDPLQSSYAKRIDDKEWQRHEASIRSMHASGRTKSQILEALQEEYAFSPS